MYEIRMDFPAKNALGTELMDWLWNELVAAGDQAVFLTGTGDAFCAGLNLKELAGLDALGVERFVRQVDEVMGRLFMHPAPTVAWVNGHAIAGGSVLALCCDHSVAVDGPDAARTKVGLNEVALGVCFPPRVLRICLARLPRRHRDEVLLGARLYRTADAHRLGLVSELAPNAEAGEELARRRLAELERIPREAYAVTKRVLHGEAMALTEADERRFEEQELPLWRSPEVKQRVLAVLGG